MKTLYEHLDTIIEDERKTKAVILFLTGKGLLDCDVVGLWEIEQANKEVYCNHKMPDGTDATFDAAGMTSCRLCGADDFIGDL